jgi:WD40 repeat protein
MDFERLDRALTATQRAGALGAGTSRADAPRVVGLVGPPGPARTAFAHAYRTRPQTVRRYSAIGVIVLGTPPPAPDGMLWPDTPEAAELTFAIVRTLREWSASRTRPHSHRLVGEPVAPERAAAELADFGRDGLLVVDGARTPEQIAMFDQFRSQGGRVLLLADHTSTLPRGAVVVWAPDTDSTVATDNSVATDSDDTRPVPVSQVLDQRWIVRRLSEDGAPGLATDLARAWATSADPAVGALLRTLRAEEAHFAGVREPRTLTALVAGRLGLPAMPIEPGPPASLEPGPPVLVNRWPAPGRFGAALIRRIAVVHAELGLGDVIVTPAGMWTAASDPFYGGAEIIRWDPLTGRRQLRLRLSDVKNIAILPSPDGTWLAIAVWGEGGDQVMVVEPATREVRGAVTGHVAVTAPDGTWIAVGDRQGEVHVHSTTTMARLQLIAAHWARITALAIAPDGSWLASSSEDGTVRITDLTTGRPGRPLSIPQVTRLTVDPGGRWLAAAGPDGVHLIDPSRGTDRRIHRGSGRPHALEAAADGSWLAVHEGPRLLLFDTVDGGLRHTFPVDADYPTSLAAAPDGTWIAAGYPMRIWDTRTGERRAGFPAGPLSSRAVSPDGTWLSAHVGSDVVILDLTAQPEPGADPAHADPVEALAVAPDGSWLATRAPGGGVRFWDASDGRPCPPEDVDVTFTPVPPVDLDEPVRKHHGDRTIVDAAVSPDQRWVAVLSLTGVDRPVVGVESQIRVYDRECGIQVAALPAIDYPAGCRWSPDGAGLFLWGAGGLYGLTWTP